MKRLILVLVLCWPVASYPAFLTGNKLMEQCDGTGKGEPHYHPRKYNACVAYLAANSDTTEAWQEGEFIKPKQMCLPEGVSAKQLRRAFLKYMRQHLDLWHSNAASLAADAFRESWPC